MHVVEARLMGWWNAIHALDEVACSLSCGCYSNRTEIYLTGVKLYSDSSELLPTNLQRLKKGLSSVCTCLSSIGGFRSVGLLVM